MGAVETNVCLTISEGVELSCAMHSSDEACVTLGESSVEHELTFDFASLTELVTQATRVLAEMDAKADAETAEWEATQPK